MSTMTMMATMTSIMTLIMTVMTLILIMMHTDKSMIAYALLVMCTK